MDVKKVSVRLENNEWSLGVPDGFWEGCEFDAAASSGAGVTNSACFWNKGATVGAFNMCAARVAGSAFVFTVVIAIA